MEDVRFAFRIFRRHPAYVAMVVATLAVALGGITALTSVADATFLAPLPIPDGDRVVSLYDTQPQYGREPASTSWPELMDWREHATQLSGVAGERAQSLSWRGTGEPERVVGSLVSRDYFQVFGTTPVLGRPFTDEEHAKGGPLVAILSHGFWERALGGDRDIVGRTVTLDGLAHTVVGVLGPGGPESARGPRDVFIPIEPRLPSEERGEHYLTVFGRLTPGATIGSLQAELDRLGPILDKEGSGHRAGLMTLRDSLYGKARPGLLVLFVAALVVLVIAASNVTGVMLARMQGRAQELGVRAALGASRARLARQLLVESVLLALLGGALGLILAMWGKDLLLALWPRGAPKPTAVPLSWSTMAVTAGVALLVGAVVGAVPALRASRADLASSMRAGAVPRSQRLRSVLVVLQHALAILLLCGAALLGKSLLALVAVSPGFDAEGVVTMDIGVPVPKYPDDERRRALYEDVAGRLRELPGVESASMISNIPFGRSNTSGSFEIEGRPEAPSHSRPHAARFMVDGAYFKTMRIPLLAGRTFTEADRQPLLIINETFAKKMFPGENPIGRRIDAYGGFAEVIGVVGDVRRRQLDEPAELQVYQNLARTAPWATFVVRTSGDPTALFAAMKAQLWSVDPGQPVTSIGTMSDLLAQSASGRRIVSIMVTAFAAIALFLAALGIYGVLSYSVSQRTREIGVRMALGARAGTVLRHVLAQGLKLSLIGVALGVVVAIVLMRFLGSFLFQVSPVDPVVYVTVAAALIGVGVVACWAPARRAAKVDPMTALRSD